MTHWRGGAIRGLRRGGRGGTPRACADIITRDSYRRRNDTWPQRHRSMVQGARGLAQGTLTAQPARRTELSSLRSLVPQPFCKRTRVVRRGLFAPTLTPHPPCDGLEERLGPWAYFFAERERDRSVREELRDSFLTPVKKYSRCLPCCARARAHVAPRDACGVLPARCPLFARRDPPRSVPSELSQHRITAQSVGFITAVLVVLAAFWGSKACQTASAARNLYNTGTAPSPVAASPAGE